MIEVENFSQNFVIMTNCASRVHEKPVNTVDTITVCQLTPDLTNVRTFNSFCLKDARKLFP
jgi:hypothetical protein